MADFTITLTDTQTLVLRCYTMTLNAEHESDLDENGKPLFAEMKEAEVARYLLASDLQNQIPGLQARTQDLCMTLMQMDEEQRKIILEALPNCGWKLWLVARLNSKDPNGTP